MFFLVSLAYYGTLYKIVTLVLSLLVRELNTVQKRRTLSATVLHSF